MRDLTMFLVAARHGSFRGAADELGLDRSALSKGIARLEARVRTRLFHRNTRSITLTAAGEALATGAHGPLQELLGLLDGLADAPVRGRVRVAAPLTFGLSRVAPALHVFLREHPEVDLEVSYDEEVHDIVDEGVDVAVRGGSLQDSDLVCRHLVAITGGMFAAPEFPTDHVLLPSDLLEVPLLLHRRGPLILERAGEVVTLRPTPHLLTRATQGRVLAAQAGLGVAMLPDFADLSGLKRVLPEWRFPESLAFYLVRPPGTPSPAAQALWDHLLDWLGKPSEA